MFDNKFKELVSVETKYWAKIFKNDEEFSEELRRRTSFLDCYDDIKINERVYCYLNNIKDIICPVCGKNKKLFRNFKIGYMKTCGIKCSNISRASALKKTCTDKYGVDNPQKISEVVSKTKQTKNEKYNGLLSNIVSIKSKETLVKRYGVTSPLKSNALKEKQKNTMIKRYGVSNASQLSKNQTEKNREKNYDLLLDQLKIKNIQLLMTKDEFVTLKNNKVKFRCLKCNKEFESEFTGITCLSCFCSKTNNKNMTEFLNWIKTYTTNIVINEEDNIFLKDYKMNIKFINLFWDSELYKEKLYHLNNIYKCIDDNVKLMYIFDNEWEMKKDIIKSIILNKMGIFDKRLYGRKCEVKEVDVKLYRNFIAINHLQGFTSSKVKLGLYYNNELVSIMGFGLNRFKKNEIEIIRYCSKLNTQIIGGFSKLLNYFIKNYEFDNLVSYCDIRYFDGKGYEKCGFEKINETYPNYFYWKTGNDFIENRIRYQKHKLGNILNEFDEKRTEVENMYKNNYLRIFDCGNIKLKFLK